MLVGRTGWRIRKSKKKKEILMGLLFYEASTGTGEFYFPLVAKE
jgi:hypothetical protein